MKIRNNLDTVIILLQNATDREVFAAEELRKYIKQITNIELAICQKDLGIAKNKIIIGGPERNDLTKKLINETEFDRLVPGPEGMIIKTYGDNTLLIAGSSKNPNECERGTIYAVYEFLERYLGCSLSAYTNPDIAGGEHVPVLKVIELNDIEYIKAASDSEYRTAIVQFSNSKRNPVHGLNMTFIDWLVKNRYNRILTWSSVYEKYKENGTLIEAERRGIRFTVGHHESPQLFLPPTGNSYFPEHYYETHPEYYKLLENGERYQASDFWGQWIFCSRNGDAISQISKNVISWISQNPSVDIIAFWPQDGIFPQCTCERCTQHSKVSNYTYFLNEVAKRVNAVHPNVKIDMLIYVDLWEYPEDIKLEPSLIIDESTWHDSGLRCVGKPDGSGIIGTFFESNLLKWKEAGAQAVYYDYYMGVYPARQRYIPMADEIQSLNKHFVKTGIVGSGTQIECYNMWNNIFNFYAFARIAYDNSLSMDDCLASFTRIFGAGAPYIAKNIREAEACLDGQASIMDAGIYLIEHINKEIIYQEFENALKAAETPAHRNNIRMMRMAFRYSDVECSDELAKTGEYSKLKKYSDPTGELYYMSSRFDSFSYNDPGYGISIPVDCKNSDFKPDHWYVFEA